ncbi:hypothetical protein BLNAU_13939 [Blattamonas nauphoetae]|uniref:SPRY domain-containing protein n=1 Tax=Blattamonas nauphoetae TaxID=2049346 RepID=A0ABQ9XF51_9EUKA|nr:hypothetical protein BLNAU_13939 [Blattamonas nauphoetae]
MFKAATLSDVGPFNNLPTNSSNRSSTSAEEKSNQVDGPHGWDVDMMHLESNMKIMHLGPTPLITLPRMDFTDPSLFSIMHTTIVHTTDNSPSYWRSVLLSNPFTSGILSFTITILSFRDAYIAVDSIGLNKSGYVKFNTPSETSYVICHSELNEGDCIRMEVDLDSTPRTVQFFVNGKAGECYMSGIPSSVRIGV